MPSVQRYLSGRDNLVRTAALAASSVRPSTAIERIGAQRTGGGRARLAGAYTGHEAAQIDVEVVAAGGIPRASVPQFVGVGNGQLQVAAVDAAAPLQGITLTLADLGIPTESAALDVRELRIVARTPGAAGNSIRITVAPQLTRTATQFSLLADWSAGTALRSGSQWDFGGLPLTARGELDAASPRLQFGFDPQVYRAYRVYKDGAWQFGLSPALERDVPAGTAVFSVAGGYIVTVTDGATTETFGDTGAGQPAVVTFYDLVEALSTSALVEVGGVTAADRTVGGQAAIDVPLRTQAWLLSLGGKVKLQNVVVPPGAPTQAVTVRCINADKVGLERWSVTGDVSGALPVATTGESYATAAIEFAVPVIAPATVDSGEWSFKYEPTSRAESEGLPSVCVRPFRFGVNAKARSVTFRYQKRPPADCKCSDMPTPRVSLACLGLEGEAMALDAAYQSRLEVLYEWQSEFVASNTNPGIAGGYAKWDMDFVGTAVAVFAECLAEVYEAPPALAEWDAGFTAMKADLSWMLGLSGGLNIKESQGFSAWLNPLQGRVYQWLGQTLAGVSGSHIAYPGESGWVDPADPAWDTSGATFTTVGALTGGGSVTNTWRCLPTSDVVDMDAREGVDLTAAATQLVRRYSARMDYVRTLAGIVPKSDPSSGDAGGCWVDHGGDWWWVDTSGRYLPAFTNEGYVSAKRNKDTGKPESTKEFGFGLVVACPERLKKGDEITLRILTVDAERPYRVGDEAVLQTIGAGAAWLTGGIDGTDVQTWRVLGSSAGELPDYIVPTDGTAAPLYEQAGVALRLALGGIAFQLGDAFSFAVEAGQFRWRRSGEAWSALADIPPGGQVALADGLQAAFDAGAAPSFVPGDAYAFVVHQPWAASNLQNAQATAWGWEGSDATMTIDLGTVRPLGAMALARYQLPGGAAVAAEVSQDGVAWSAPLALDVTRAVSVAMFHLAMAARFVRLSVTNAPGGSIGWVWCGQPLATEHHASTCERLRRWASTRGGGLNAAALYAGAGTGWKLAWDNALLEPDVAALLRMGDWAQAHDEPLIFVPHPMHEADASLVRWGADALQVTDLHAYQPDNDAWRLMSATLDLEPVFA